MRASIPSPLSPDLLRKPIPSSIQIWYTNGALVERVIITGDLLKIIGNLDVGYSVLMKTQCDQGYLRGSRSFSFSLNREWGLGVEGYWSQCSNQAFLFVTLTTHLGCIHVHSSRNIGEIVWPESRGAVTCEIEINVKRIIGDTWSSFTTGFSHQSYIIPVF